MPKPQAVQPIIAPRVIRPIITKRRLSPMLGLGRKGRNRIDLLMKAEVNPLPPPDLWLGPRTAAWFEDTIADWLDARAAETAADRVAARWVA